MYAIFETGGKQHKVEKGDVLYVEKLEIADGESITFDTVVFIDSGKTKKIGTPYVKGATVTATVDKTGKGKKLTVFTYKAKKNEKRKLGHRQPYTKLTITGMAATAPKAKKEETDTETAE